MSHIEEVELPDRILSADLLQTVLIAVDSVVGDAVAPPYTWSFFGSGFFWTLALGFVAGLLAGLYLAASALMPEREQLIEAANTDALTGLMNRLAFARFADGSPIRAVLPSFAYGDDAKGDGVGVVFLDIKNFKQINDTYGHVAGDEVLRVIGQRLAAFAGVGEIGVQADSASRGVLTGNRLNADELDGDAVFFRMGGDEFLGLMTVPSRERLNQGLRVLKSRLTEPILIDAGNSAGGRTPEKHAPQVATIAKTTSGLQTTSCTLSNATNIQTTQSIVVLADAGVAWGTPDATLNDLYRAASDDLRDQRLATRLQATDK